MSKTKPKRYSEAFKRKVVKEVQDGMFTKDGAKKYYGLGGNSAILYWTRKYSGYNNPRHPLGLPNMNSNPKKNIQAARIKELEEKLLLEKQRADLWQNIVEIAEEELGLNIKKKFGARLFTEQKKKGSRE